jgi:hypothetical protein
MGVLIGPFARTHMIAPGCIYGANNCPQACQDQVALFRVLDLLTQQHQRDRSGCVFDASQRDVGAGEFSPAIITAPLIVVIIPLCVCHARNNSDAQIKINRKLQTARRYPLSVRGLTCVCTFPCSRTFRWSRAREIWRFPPENQQAARTKTPCCLFPCGDSPACGPAFHSRTDNSERRFDMKTRVVHCKREAHDVYIGRPGKWGNPFVIGRDGTREQVIAKYRQWLVSQAALVAALPELKGKTLGCWCAPNACHGDVLAEMADK